MKSFILLVSIVFLLGCEHATKSSNKGGGGGGGAPELIFVSYRATIEVNYENGKPCTTAFADLDDREFFADSTGIIEILEFHSTYSDTFPDTVIYPCIVYRNYHKEIIWEGDIQLINYAYSLSGWPDPFMEIVISDSLAP